MILFDIRQSSFNSPTLMTSQDFAVCPRAAAGWQRRRITAPLIGSILLFCLRGERGLRTMDWTTDHLWPLGVNQVVSS